MPRDDDDDDDRPRSRRRSDDDDEDDDRPRRRSRRDDDDDDEWDRPRSGRKKKGSSGPTVLIVVVVALLGCCGGAGVIGYFGVGRVREAAGRTHDTNNLKQISIGVHDHHAQKGLLPPATGDLSWRVHLLPYIEQENLHRQFDLTQPWNAGRNLPLADTKVPAYVSALDGNTPQTRYRVYTGHGTLYEPGKPPKRMTEVADGTANTAFAFEAGDTVPWSQPKELSFTGVRPELGHPDRDVVLIGMMDGSVRVVRKKDLDSAPLLHALVTPAGGERVELP